MKGAPYSKKSRKQIPDFDGSGMFGFGTFVRSRLKIIKNLKTHFS